MSEEFVGKEEFKGYKLSIFWGRLPEFEMYDRDICSIHVKYEHEGGIIFIEQTHIAHIAEKEVQRQIEKHIHKDEDLRSLLIKYTAKKLKIELIRVIIKRGKLILKRYSVIILDTG